LKAKLVLVLLALIFTLGACDLFAGVGSDDIDQGTSTAEEIGSTSSLVPGATNTDRQQDDPGTDLVGESTAASSASDEITTTHRKLHQRRFQRNGCGSQWYLW